MSGDLSVLVNSTMGFFGHCGWCPAVIPSRKTSILQEPGD